MRILSTPTGATLAEKVASIRALEADGFAGAWVPSMGHDALTVLALAGGVTERIELGTYVQPTYARHPVAMAQQALTTQAATGNRLTLGLGLSHQVVIEDMWGLDFSAPVRHMREYLEVLLPLLRGEAVRYRGADFRVTSELALPDAAAPSVVVAALGPQMLRLTARLTDGTALWLAGLRYVEEVVVPTMAPAAAAAGRPAPRVIVGLPVAVTGNVEAARERINRAYVRYTELPSYQRVVTGSGGERVADVALVGTEESIETELRRLRDAGATDFYAAFEGEDTAARERTRAFFAALAPTI